MFRLTCALLMGLIPVSASAQQSYEVVGARALGMAGAFVAVADDATAVFWNPAGLVAGNAMGGTIDWGRFQFGNRDIAPIPGPSEGSANLTSFGSWPVGLSYARFESTVLVDDESGSPAAFNVRTSHIGLTVLQTLVENLVIGSTFKYVRGRTDRALAEGATVAEALDRGSDLEGRARGTFDFDIGVMADMQQLRVGLTVRNVRQPTFGTVAENEITLKRRARLGVALLPTTGLILAMDLDLDTADLEGGPSRILALGGEARLGLRLAVRSGVRMSVEGDRRIVKAVGTSYMIRPRVWLDGHFSQGGEGGHRAFGLALRAGM
ncbi:MAG TPA: conjugal transfer protein TraF [Vicinamibacterales bacterium]|nr:conjugal transfer protein TraF [Vicinamibacterales bacterium]